MRKSFYLKTIFLCCLGLMTQAIRASNQGFSDDTLRYGALLVDKLSIRLTGLPADPATKQDFLEGKKNLDQIAEEWRADPNRVQAMVSRMSEFWNQAFGIYAPIDIFRVSIKKTGDNSAKSVIDDMVASAQLNKIPADNSTKGAASKRLYYRNMGSIDCNAPASGTGCRNAFCWPCTQSPGGALAFGPIYVVERGVNGLSGAALGESAEARRVYTCTADTIVQVAPWWSPGTLVNTCPDTTLPDFCGPQFEKCMPIDKSVAANHDWRDALYQWPEWLNVDFTREPGMLAARVVFDGRRWDDVVRGTQSVASGVMYSYVKRFAGGGLSSRFTDAAPAGTYKKADGTWQTLVGAPSAESSLALDRRFYWVDRGAGHAGIFTTPAWQMTFNGHRAKANAAMETFLCEKFQIPEGSRPVPSEETDLTKRPYCSLCHMTLEPLSGYFKRWPAVGNTNYLYSPSAPAQGGFKGFSGEDASGLAANMIQMPQFSACAVNRAFEFLVGRTLNAQELSYLMPTLLKTFQDNDRKLWPVMKQIISLPVFAGERNQ